MKPIGTTSAVSSDAFEEYSDARGADNPHVEHETRWNIRLGLSEDLYFDPSDQVAMEQQDELQLILRFQSELVESNEQLALRAPIASSVFDTSVEATPPSPSKPKIMHICGSTFKGNEVYPRYVIRTEELLNEFTCSNDINVSVIVSVLEGKHLYFLQEKSDWQRRHDNESMSYSEAKRSMRVESSCKLIQLELSTKL
ncbi:hypothetical protein PHMEG_0003781 [Phytophthora megakarya]|uniref:Uncharacterized protein n=1 Tax=Phytophthora megakarya TaxID=4795 RepID=A0A225WVJ8_9STRA|nr:hypothetical protein PHMEG_0003781 [Phytophthora megakarya]